jgi:YfiH family protein
MDPIFFTHPFLQHDAIAHGFFSRRGGASTGLYASLNIGQGSHDDKTHVAENRRRVSAALGMAPQRLCTLYQVHSPNVIVIAEPFAGPPPQADALVTNIPGLTLGILTADCAPVLFADTQAQVVGAAHAGWKGAVGGVLENTIAAMLKLGAARERITAVIGPAIAQASYEIGAEFIARFDANEQAEFFIPGRTPGHFMFDLPNYTSRRLARAGLQRVAVLAMDTCADEANFFSYRRATLRDEPDYGRQISVIGIKDRSRE